MKLPRNLSGADLAQALKKLGYSVTRRTGSQLRLVAPHFGLSREELAARLWQ